MLHEVVLATDVDHACKTNLRDDGTEFATRRSDTVAGGPITCGEGFSGNDEGRGVRTKVLEEVGQTVKEYKRLRRCGGSGELVKRKAYP